MPDDKRAIPDDFEVTRCDLPAFRGDFTQLDYRDPLAARRVQLREECDLDGVAAGCGTEFEAQCALKRWGRSRWDHGWSLSFSTVQDALDVLHEVRSVNVCGRLGITSRLEVAYAPAKW